MELKMRDDTNPKMNISKLCDIGMLNSDGKLSDYKDLNNAQTLEVIKRILKVANGGPEHIREYLQMNSSAGRTLLQHFPEFVVHDIMKRYHAKMIDTMLLAE